MGEGVFIIVVGVSDLGRLYFFFDVGRSGFFFLGLLFCFILCFFSFLGGG